MHFYTVGVMDMSLPLAFNLKEASAGLGETLQLFSGFRPIVSITTDDLFGTLQPSFAVDFGIETMIGNGENILGSLLGKLTGGLGIIGTTQGGSSKFNAGPLG